MPEFEFLQQLTPYLLGLGLVGLFLLALIDSAGLPTGGGPDLVLLILTVDAVTSAVISETSTPSTRPPVLGMTIPELMIDLNASSTVMSRTVISSSGNMTKKPLVGLGVVGWFSAVVGAGGSDAGSMR